MRNKEGDSVKYFAFSQISILVISLFAFSFIVGGSSFVSGKSCYEYDGLLNNYKTITIPDTGNCEQLGFYSAIPKASSPDYLGETPPSSTDIPTGASAIASIVQSSSSKAGSFLTFEGKNYFVTGGSLKAGETVKAIDIATSEKATLKLVNDQSVIDKALTPATSFEKALATKPVDLVSGEKTTALNAIRNNLKYTPESLKSAGIDSITKLENGDYEVLGVDGTKTVYDSVGKVLSTTEQSTFKIPFTDITLQGFWADFASGAVWAAGIYTAIKLGGPLFGLEKETTDALATSAALGVFAGKAVYGLAKEGTFKSFLDGSFLEGVSPTQLGLYAGIGVGVLTFILLYKKNKEEIVSFQCKPWLPPTGGANCEKCNSQDFPCSEYQCKSLGQACDIVNPGTSEERCVWVNKNDVNPPTIEPSTDFLLNGYRYSPDNTISPPDKGVKIVYDNSPKGCIPAFTPLRFGVKLNEPAACKIDTTRKSSFDNMTVSIDSGLLKYNHSYALSLPGSDALKAENITVQNDGNYELFVRCQDANGNSNVANFVFKYCVDDGPDTTPPVIITTSILNNAPIAFNQSEVDLSVYTNEPANCRWSHDDKDFTSMEETMSCSSGIFDFNAQALYKCSTTLTGLNDKADNNFYFRCEDKPNQPESDRNRNAESYKFNLIGTQPLAIDSVAPNDTTISGSTTAVKTTLEATTSAGYKDGESICYYSNSGDEGSFIKFFNTSSYKHSQDLYLASGSYDYFIRCTDLGGNSDTKEVKFDVEVDLDAPKVVRAYKEENYLKLITNENANCVYSTFSCNYDFNEGTAINVVNGTSHFTTWDTNTNLYVKCEDKHQNSPAPDQCSISVKPSDF